ncbi:DNA-binding response regulator in two-component regulatory system with CreC [Burkholderiales bacterium 8X]|nr:DNA-binding response regulator in two-component regulatory system with CreC [Burkholderiales bacterium 8X]
MPPKPRILIAEDESAIADTLRYVLETDGFLPVWCPTAAEAIARFRAEPPALAILDVGLPDMNGFELFKRLQALPGAAAVPMLFLTARSDEIDRVVGLELGADDYVAKPFSPRELVARVRSILRRTARRTDGEMADEPDAGASNGMDRATPPSLSSPPSSSDTVAPASAPVSQRGPFQLDTERMQIRYYGRPLELSRYEYGLLRLLVQRPGRVFTRDELLQQVWDDASDSFDRTVDAHVKTLRAKLRAIAPEVEPIRTLRGTGYALNEDLPAST